MTNKNKKQITKEELLELFEKQMFSYKNSSKKFITIKTIFEIKEIRTYGDNSIIINESVSIKIGENKNFIDDFTFCINKFISLYTYGKASEAIDFIIKRDIISLIDKSAVLVIKEELESIEKKQNVES
jgi:hypothetical protein